MDSRATSRHHHVYLTSSQSIAISGQEAHWKKGEIPKIEIKENVWLWKEKDKRKWEQTGQQRELAREKGKENRERARKTNGEEQRAILRQ